MEIISVTDVKQGDTVEVCWGTLRDRYRAAVRSFYSGRVVQVQYDDGGEDWRQWVKVENLAIVRKL